MNQTILALGAHPDDVELGCGGTLAQRARQGARIHAMVFTRGESARCAIPACRQSESRAALSLLGVQEVRMLDFGDTRLISVIGEMARQITAALESSRPDALLIPPRDDRHQDHWALRIAAEAAIRSWPAPATVLGYESASCRETFMPHCFELLDDEAFTSKIHALGLHRSQQDKAYMAPDCIETRARFRAYQAGAPRALAEGFEVVRILLEGGKWQTQSRTL